ncbi:ABC transporter substrate-binding protein [Candidatus Bathyarchaeota archaeon]|nr:ABC transporter substrate-binding protein [Candidatus Bathyarchaeota archaeon]
MNKKAFVLAVILATFMAFGMISIAFAANGPKTPNMEIRIYANPNTENQDLQAGVLDINDWPLTQTWIDAWALMPQTVTLDSYAELGMYEIDINNQMWPTGDSNNKFYTPSSAESVKAVAFRQAVACLVDRDSIVRDVLEGYGFRMDVPLPPFQSAYIDMINYTESNVLYNFNRARAAAILDAAGFTMLGSGLRQDPLTPGVALEPLVFYIRQDDPNRRQAGEMLTSQLRAVGIQVNAIITESTVCYRNVMVLYDYNLYTGGWSLSSIPDQYHDLYSSFTYYGPSIGWSQNYPGFCNSEFDAWAAKVKYPATEAEAQTAAKTAGYLFLKYCAIVPMYCSKLVKAYRTGWTGVVNNAGIGVDNYYTFLNGNNPTDDTWSYGFSNDIERLNQVSSEWLWDQNVLGLTYESLLGSNPYNLAPTEYFIASAKTVGTWNAAGVGGDAVATYITFTIRTDVYWHNGADAPTTFLTPDDVKFSFDFQKACGPGIAWNYPSLSQYYNATISGNDVTIRYKKQSYWAVQWAGGLPILRKSIWNNLWNIGDLTWQARVMTYDPANQDIDEDGVNDLYRDGTGAWIFRSYSEAESITLVANSYYYLSQAYISSRLADMFWLGAGDVNRNGVVNTQDLGYMARAMFTDSDDLLGTDWGQYNPDCDLNGDNKVDLVDLIPVIVNYGKTAG